MRIPLIAGNWKMNMTIADARKTVNSLLPLVSGNEVEVVLVPPFTALYAVHDIIRGTKVKLGAQDVFWEESGAYTGEISPPMLVDAGCSYVIVGHSERRGYFGETNISVNRKVAASLKNNLCPILCIGETLQEKEEGKTLDILENGLLEGLRDLKADQLREIVIAYEPIWAIGTGKTATPEQANESHLFIRGWMKNSFDRETSELIRIIYGGSVTSENIDRLMAQPEIDGALIGGASLKADSFVKIVNYRIRKE